MVVPIRIPRAMSVATAEVITVPRPLRRGKAGLARVLISLGLGGVHVAHRMRQLCLRRGSSVLEPTLSVLKLGVRTRPKCQSDEMAPAVASRRVWIADRHNPTGVYSADELTVLPGGAPGGS